MAFQLTEFTLVGDQPMGPGARCARSATTVRIFPKEGLGEHWKTTFQLTLTRWRRRIRTFRAYEVIKPKRYLVSANCAPWGFHVQQDGKDWRYCRNEACPWCHMRKVDQTYSLVEKKFRAEQDRNPDVVLWSLSKIRKFPAATADPDLAVWARRFHHEALATTYAADLDGLGSIWRISIGPDQKNDWQVTSRALVLMDAMYPLIRCQGWRREKIESWRPEALIPVISTHLRYPAGYLRGNPEFAARTLLFNDRLRTEKKLLFSGRTGVFRKE